MKYIWEEKDFQATDRQNLGMLVIDKTGHLWMTVYQTGNTGNIYGIASLQDGMIIRTGIGYTALVTYLNKNEYRPFLHIAPLESILGVS